MVRGIGASSAPFGKRPAIPSWAAEVMDNLFPLVIPPAAGELWGPALVEQAVTAFSLVVSEDWTSLERARVETSLNTGLAAMCNDGQGSGPPATLANDAACARCAAGMLTRHPNGAALVDLFRYMQDQPAWQRLAETGLLGSGPVQQLAAAGRLLVGHQKESFEQANAAAGGVGAGPGFVVVLRALGFTGPATGS